jgi:hypothetical protein
MVETDRERADRLEAIVKAMEPIYQAAVLVCMDQDEAAPLTIAGIWVKPSRWNALRRAVEDGVEIVRNVHKHMGRQDVIVRLKGVEAMPFGGL